MQTQELQSWVAKLSHRDAESCLANLRQLANQLDLAMNAIVERQLPSLQCSLRVQNTSCATLVAAKYRLDQRLEEDRGGETKTLDPDLAAEIKAATESLLTLNKRYAALIKHSGTTLQLLGGLYRGYCGSVQPGSAIAANLQTWSCEV